MFGGIHRRLRGVGLSSIACGYMLVTYYSMLLAWVCNAFFMSFSSDNFWAQDEVTGTEAKNFFFNNIIGMETLGDDMLATRMVWKNAGYSLLSWVVIYLCVAFGLKATGRITYFTMGLPVILLFVFLGRAVSLPGAQAGIDEYIKDANWDVLADGVVWQKAVTQIFFSLGITFGIMTAYGSHCKRDEPAFLNSCVISISNCLFSFIAGFAVFATLGYQADLDGLDSIADLEYKSFGLVFGSWPVALGTLPGGEHWVRLFFIMLFLLGIDSAFSFVEAFLTAFQDAERFKNVNRKILTLFISVVAFLFSLMYATDAGLIWLDTIDYYINFVMLLVGGFECYAAGWIYGIEEQIDNLGAKIVFSYMITTFGSVIVACCVWFGLITDNAIWAGFVALIACYGSGMIYVIILMHKKKKEDPFVGTWGMMFYDLTMKNILDLSRDLSDVVGYMPHKLWAFLIKHFICPISIILFALGADENYYNADGDIVGKTFGRYAGYPFTPYQILGILCVAFVGFLFISSLILPQMYEVFDRSPEELILLEESRKSLKDTRKASIEASRKASLHAIQQQAINKHRASSFPDTTVTDRDEVEEGKATVERFFNEQGPVGSVSFVSEPTEELPQAEVEE